MSSNVAADDPERRLSRRQADTVRRLTEAAEAELRAAGSAGLTVRGVAARAGVAAATAYTYFSSRSHLVVEVLWRRLRAMPAGVDGSRPPIDAVSRVMRDIVGVVVADPELAAASTAALLGGGEREEADVARLRLRVGAEVRARIREALGDADDPRVLTALEFAYAGALLRAGMGISSYEQVAEELVSTAEMVMRGGT